MYPREVCRVIAMCFGSSCFLLACFFSLPPIFWGQYMYKLYTFCTLVFLSDVLTGAWEMDCGLVAMVTSLMLRRELPPLLLPLQYLPSNKFGIMIVF